YYITYYNAVQQPYNKIKRKFDIKKTLHKRHLEYLRFYNCRTTVYNKKILSNIEENGVFYQHVEYTLK
ncbi:hypothetical protein, partial [Holdemanella biformis]